MVLLRVSVHHVKKKKGLDVNSCGSQPLDTTKRRSIPRLLEKYFWIVSQILVSLLIRLCGAEDGL